MRSRLARIGFLSRRARAPGRRHCHRRRKPGSANSKAISHPIKFSGWALHCRSVCSMFVLMVAELSSPILSDAPPALIRRAQLGSHFQFRCSRSDKSFLFSPVPFDSLGDFRSAIVLIAEPAGDGDFIAWAAAIIDSTGQLCAEDRSWPSVSPPGSLAFVHFLAETDHDHHDLIKELVPHAVTPEFSLAA